MFFDFSLGVVEIFGILLNMLGFGELLMFILGCGFDVVFVLGFVRLVGLVVMVYV